MATPSSTSAYHRRRSFRDLKENAGAALAAPPAKAPTPPLPPPDVFPLRAPSILGTRNLPPVRNPVRELFATPRASPPARAPGLAAARLARRAARAAAAAPPIAPAAAAAAPRARSPGARTLRAVAAAGVVGACGAAGVAGLCRGVLRLGRADGAWGLALRALAVVAAGLLTAMVVVGGGSVSGASRAPALRLASVRAARFVLGARERALHAALLVAACVLQTLAVCAAGGALGARGARLGAVTRAAAAGGAAFSYVAQARGAFVWRFSPTRAPPLARLRADAPHAAALAAFAAGAGAAAAALGAAALRQLARAVGAPLPPPAPPLGLQVVAAVAAFGTLLAWALAIATAQIALTTPLAVADYVVDAAGGAVKADAQRNRDAVEMILADLAPRRPAPCLSQLVSLQFFRDVARSSPPGRAAVFADASGHAWSALCAGCLLPIDALTERLAAAAPSARRAAVYPATGRARAVGSGKYAPDFGESRSVVWAAEALSHFLVASREEDDYGVAQRTFVHSVASLIACKEQVDAARQRLAMTSVLVDNVEAGEKTVVARVFEYESPHDKYFATESVAGAVSDALNLALFRLVDAFRVHLQGYLVGAEAHWERRFDKSLKACLEMTGI